MKHTGTNFISSNHSSVTSVPPKHKHNESVQPKKIGAWVVFPSSRPSKSILCTQHIASCADVEYNRSERDLGSHHTPQIFGQICSMIGYQTGADWLVSDYQISIIGNSWGRVNLDYNATPNLQKPTETTRATINHPLEQIMSMKWLMQKVIGPPQSNIQQVLTAAYILINSPPKVLSLS